MLDNFENLKNYIIEKEKLGELNFYLKFFNEEYLLAEYTSQKFFESDLYKGLIKSGYRINTYYDNEHRILVFCINNPDNKYFELDFKYNFTKGWFILDDDSDKFTRKIEEFVYGLIYEVYV